MKGIQLHNRKRAPAEFLVEVPMMYKRAVVSVGVLLLIACDPGEVTDAKSKTPILRRDACETQIYPDPSCDGSGFQGQYVADGDGAMQVITIDNPPPPPSGVVCPVAIYRVMASGTITSFSPPVPWVISGTWRLDPSYINPARYIFPSGWWDVADGSGRQVSIGSSDAQCQLIYYPEQNMARLYVHFGPHYYNVQVATPTSSGGSTGGGSNCEAEFITIQVNDGTGWKDWWSGYATVCT